LDSSIFTPLVSNLKQPMPAWAYHEERSESGKHMPGSGCGMLNMHIPGVWDLVVERLGLSRAHEANALQCKCDANARAQVLAAFDWSRLAPTSQLRPPKTFENFNIRHGTEEAYNAAHAMVEKDATPPPTLVLVSDGTGTGKSHLAEAICRVYLAANARVRLERVPALMRALQPPADQSEDRRDILRFTLQTARPLWLDELGGEKPSAFTEQEILSVIDYRQTNGKPTIITTNRQMGWFNQVGYDRIGSRLFGENTGDTKVVVIPDWVTDYRMERSDTPL